MTNNNFEQPLFRLKKGNVLQRIRERGMRFVKRNSLRQQEETTNQRLNTWNTIFSDGQTKSTEFDIETGVRMRLYSDDLLSQVIFCGYFELGERVFLNKYLRKGDVFVDIGANIGMYTVIAAHIVGNTGQVYSFEPTQKTYDRLVANVQINNYLNVVCEKYAVSDKMIQQGMNVSQDYHDAWNSLTLPVGGSHFSTEMVNTLRFDDYARDHDLFGRVRMIKLDVEGWEIHVLSGAMDYFSREDAPLLQVEFSYNSLKVAGTSCNELYQLLETLGYQMFTYSVKRDKLIKATIEYINTYDGLNIIATKKLDQ